MILFLVGCRLFDAREQVTPHESISAGQTNVFYTTNYIYTVEAGLTNTLGAAREIARDAGGPWGGIAAVVFGALSAVLGRIAHVKSRQAALVPALITGVETANNEAVKKLVKQAAKAAGVEDRLNDTVRKITR